MRKIAACLAVIMILFTGCGLKRTEDETKYSGNYSFESSVKVEEEVEAQVQPSTMKVEFKLNADKSKVIISDDTNSKVNTINAKFNDEENVISFEQTVKESGMKYKFVYRFYDENGKQKVEGKYTILNPEIIDEQYRELLMKLDVSYIGTKE